VNASSAHPPGPVLEVRLLGGFALVRATTQLTIATSLQRLVAFLALRGPTARTQVAGVLWPSTPDGRAMASLRTAVWRLRRTAPALLSEHGGSLSLSAAVSVDAARLAAGIDLSLLRGHAGGPSPDLLPGWYDDWVVLERERVRHRYLRLLESAAALAIDAGNCPDALDWALSAAAVDPLRESAHRLVIRALLADGNVEAARRHLAFVARIFGRQLGLGPSHALTGLFDRPATAAPRAALVAPR
jgi:DNA-binding SARP family transcriptional activator